MRRALLLLVVAATVLAMAAGVALAVNKSCNAASSISDCVGTREADTLTAADANEHDIAGMEGNDIITGGEWHDDIYGDEGNDTIVDSEGSNIDDRDRVYGDEGNDIIDVREGRGGEDNVSCGPGKKDKVYFDQGTDTITGCEIKKPDQNIGG